jgi:hypothetical protein
MKALIFLLICSSLYITFTVRERDSRGQQKHSMPLKPNLELTTNIAQQKYCASGNLLLLVKYTFRNLSERNLILLKYGLYPTTQRVSRNAESANSHKYEQVVSPMLGATR